MTNARGQSETIGFALLLSLTIISVGALAVFGSAALDSSQNQIKIQQTENAMSQLDSRAAQVALGRSPQQVVDVGKLGSDDLELSDSGWLRVRIYNKSDNTLRQEVVNVSLGAVEASIGDTRVAYQGGGVWRTSDGGSSMISVPETHYRENTLTLPVISVQGNSSLQPPLVIEKNRTGTIQYPTGGDSNPVRAAEVNITVQSDYYEAWGAYFEDRTEGMVAYDHINETVTVTLATPVDVIPITNAIAGTKAGGHLQIDGTGGPAGFPYADSYNSSKGSYANQSPTSQGNITYAGDITITGNAHIEGNLKSGQFIDLTGSGDVNGTAYYTTGVDDPGNRANNVQKIDGVPEVDPVDTIIAQKLSDVRNSNDNASVSGTISDIESGGCGSTCTLTAGTYYLDKIELDGGDSLILNTSSGDITLGVNNYVALANTGGPGGSSITVQGDNQVELYIGGQTATTGGCHFSDCELVIESSSGIHIPDDRSTQLRVYGKKNFHATIQGSGGPNKASFTGVIYAPAANGGSGGVYTKHSEIFGGIVTGTVLVETMGQLHYDKALGSAEVIDKKKKVSKISYLHISVNRINVTSG